MSRVFVNLIVRLQGLKNKQAIRPVQFLGVVVEELDHHAKQLPVGAADRVAQLAILSPDEVRQRADRVSVCLPNV